MFQGPSRAPTLAKPMEVPFFPTEQSLKGWVVRCRDGYRVEVAAPGYHLSAGATAVTFVKYAPIWAARVVEEQSRNASRQVERHILSSSNLGTMLHMVKEGIREAGGRFFSLTPVAVSWQGHEKIFAVCRLRDIAASGHSLTQLHAQVRQVFNVSLLFDRLPPRARIRADVDEARQAGKVLEPGSVIKPGTHSSSGIFPLVSNVGLPTIAIDAVGTTRPEDLITASQRDDGTIEVWRFVPDDQHGDKFHTRLACPAFGVGYIVDSKGGDRPLTPVRALVKMHRQFQESDGEIFAMPRDVAPRFVRVLDALKAVLRIRGNGHLPTSVALGSEMVSETFHGSGRALFQALEGADVRLIVRKDFARGEVRRVLQAIAPELEEWELRSPELFAFQLARLTVANSPESAEALINLVASDGAFAVRRPRADAVHYRARLKANSPDGRANQVALRAHLFGTPQESVSALRAICNQENERLERRIAALQATLRKESLYRFVDFTLSFQHPEGEILGFIEEQPGISMRVEGYEGAVSLSSWDLGAAVRAASVSANGLVPLRWAGFDTDTGRAFVRVRQ